MNDMSSNRLLLLPLPGSLHWTGSSLSPAHLNFKFAAAGELLTSAADRCGSSLAKVWGKALGQNPQQPAIDVFIDCENAATNIPQLGEDESYSLTIEQEPAAQVRLHAKSHWGALQGLTTLLQLGMGTPGLPCCEIRDQPRFAWRGLMLDPARHFLPLSSLLATVDGMSHCKLNVLHLHLSDDQGFRFQSKTYPRLASEQSYSPAELSKLVNYAAARGIRVVPELDVPGHTTSWLTAYPQWGTQTTKPTERFGVHKASLNPTDQQMVEAVFSLFTELREVFPDKHCHIGGDEVHPAWWNESESIRDYMLQQGLPDAQALQAQFNRQLHEHLARHDRQTVAWDEVLHPDFTGATHKSVVQSWRGATARDRALSAGHDCVESAGYYLDLMYPADVHYGYDPAAPEDHLVELENSLLEDERFAHIAAGMRWTHQWRGEAKLDMGPQTPPGKLLGAEACLWSELVDAQTLGIRLWSRMPALAERFWSQSTSCDADSLYPRLQQFLQQLSRLDYVQLQHDQQQGFLRAGLSANSWPLAALLEPVKWYARLLGDAALQARLRGTEMPQARPYQVHTPLNRVVDYLSPESFAAVQLADFLRAATNEERQALWHTWAALGQLPVDVQELAPVMEKLQRLSTVLTQFESGKLTATVAVAQIAPLQKPSGEYLLAVVAPVLRWISNVEHN